MLCMLDCFGSVIGLFVWFVFFIVFCWLFDVMCVWLCLVVNCDCVCCLCVSSIYLDCHVCAALFWDLSVLVCLCVFVFVLVLLYYFVLCCSSCRVCVCVRNICLVLLSVYVFFLFFWLCLCVFRSLSIIDLWWLCCVLFWFALFCAVCVVSWCLSMCPFDSWLICVCFLWALLLCSMVFLFVFDLFLFCLNNCLLFCCWCCLFCFDLFYMLCVCLWLCCSVIPVVSWCVVSDTCSVVLCGYVLLRCFLLWCHVFMYFDVLCLFCLCVYV